jgi:hypothetical protein
MFWVFVCTYPYEILVSDHAATGRSTLFAAAASMQTLLV